MRLASVFLISLSSLAFEVLLARIFSVTQWNHLSFMVISIALFGFGASGTFLSILNAVGKGLEKRLFGENIIPAIALFYSATAVFAIAVMDLLPLDYFKLPVDPFQALWLGLAYLILSLPFFFTGTAISLAFIHQADKAGRVYFSTMAGSGCGAVLPAVLLPLFGDARLIVLAALVPLVQIPFSLSITMGRKARFLFLPAAFFLVAGSIVYFDSFEINPSPYKALSHLKQFPGTKIVHTEHGLTGKTSLVESPHIRFAPGISLKFDGTLPNQSAIFTDGDNPVALYHIRKKDDAEFSTFTLSHAGYRVPESIRNVLIIQSGGGLAIPCAKAAGAKKITILATNSGIAEHLRRHYGLAVHAGPPRAWLARSEETFSVIHVENWGASLPGAAALNQEDLFTRNAFRDYIRHLDRDGILIVSRKLVLPPSDAVRMWAAAFEGAREAGWAGPEISPADHLAMLRNWDTYTLLFTPNRSFRFSKADELGKLADTMNFDIVQLPGKKGMLPNRHNIFDKPYHYSEIRRLQHAYDAYNGKIFFEDHFLDVAPQSDNRPFPSRFLKWSGINARFEITGSRFYSLLMSGEIVVMVVFLEALLVAGLLLVLPVAVFSGKNGKIAVRQILYFLAIGAGFMFAEIYFIKAYTLLFGHPLIALTVVLAGMLIFTGAGAMVSDSIGQRSLGPALMILCLLLAGIFMGSERAIRGMQGLPVFWRYLLAIAILAPPGLLMGFPFPLGIRFLVNNAAQRAYAWAANGCASVLTSILAAQIALSEGIAEIMACAALAYVIAMLGMIGPAGYSK